MNPPLLRSRQREVLDVIYRLGQASAADVQEALSEELNYSAVRSALRSLEEKGLIEHGEKGLRYVYSPVVPRSRASRSALAHVIRTFYDDDPTHAMKALLDLTTARDDVDFSELERLVEQARREGR